MCPKNAVCTSQQLPASPCLLPTTYVPAECSRARLLNDRIANAHAGNPHTAARCQASPRMMCYVSTLCCMQAWQRPGDGKRSTAPKTARPVDRTKTSGYHRSSPRPRRATVNGAAARGLTSSCAASMRGRPAKPTSGPCTSETYPRPRSCGGPARTPEARHPSRAAPCS